VVCLAGGSGRRRGKLSLRNGGSLFQDHATHFNLGTRTAGREPHHPQRNDILRFDAELESFQGEGQPWI